MEANNTVLVSNISKNAKEKTITDFFSFCGKIQSIYLKEEKESNSAIIQFETESAAKTALLLTNALIVDHPINVVPFSSEKNSESISEKSSIGTAIPEENITKRNFGVPDEERTKTSVIVSLIASGYILASDALEKAKEYDEKHNITLRAKVAVEQIKAKAQEFDQKHKISENIGQIKASATEKIKKVNEQYQISEKAQLAADTVKITAQMASAKVQENPTAANVINTVKSTVNKIEESVTSMYQDYKEQTVKAIKEKKKEKEKPTNQFSTNTTQLNTNNNNINTNDNNNNISSTATSTNSNISSASTSTNSNVSSTSINSTIPISSTTNIHEDINIPSAMK